MSHADLHVSTVGDDAASGSAEHPFATLSRARDAVREQKAMSGLPAGGLTVWLHEGVYRLDESFSLSEEDSGTEQSPITYRAAGNAIITGGRAIPANAFQPVADMVVRERISPEARDHVRSVDLTAIGVAPVSAAPGRFKGTALPELFVAGERLTIARWPDEGWVTFTETIDRGSRTGDDVPRGGVFIYEGDRPARWSVEHGVWLQGYWCWDWYEESLRVKSIDPEKHRIELAEPHGYGIGFDVDYPWNDAPRRYFAFNLLEELDRPGEWYLDTETAILYLWPPSGSEQDDVEISLLEEELVTLDSTSHVALEGLTFQTSRGSAITIAGGTSNTVAGCTFRNLGVGAVAVSGGSRHRVVSCDIFDVGGFGISLTGGDRQSLTPGGHEALNNHIYRFARIRRTYAGAVHLYGVGNRAAHNLIHDAPHLAMEFIGNDHVIEFNHIHRVARETGDVGALYSGRDWTARGNLIRHNYIHDLAGPGVVGSMGVYLDDCLCGTEVYGNIIGGATYALHTGGGRDSIFRNNIVLDSRYAVHMDARCAGLGDDHKLKPVYFERLQAVPYRAPPWSERYPELVDILEDEPGIPKRNVVERNVAVGCEDWIHAPGMEPYLPLNRIENNLVVAEFDEVGLERSGDLGLRLKKDAPVFERVPGFEAIPFADIGLFVDEFRSGR